MDGNWTRASAFNRIPQYLQTAHGEVCLLVQVENRRGTASLDEILAVDGVDGVFLGPADLGFLGQPGASEVQSVVENALSKIVASGKAAGILTADKSLARHYIDIGATFVAVGTDVGLFSSATSALAAAFDTRPQKVALQKPDGVVY